MEVMKPVFETETDDGLKIIVEGPEIPKPKFEEVEIPPNEKIESALQRGKETLRAAAHETKLDSRGRKIEKDMEEIIDSTAQLIIEKNADQQVQRLVTDLHEAVVHNKEKVAQLPHQLRREMEDKIPLPEQLKRDVLNLFGFLKNLTWNFIRSEEFRIVLVSWVNYVQSLGIQKIKEEASKEEELGLGKAVAEGLQEPKKTVPEEELQKRSQDILHKLLSELANRPEYQVAVKDILKLFDALKTSLDDMSDKPPVEIEDFRRAFEDAMSLLNQFTGRKRLVEFRQMCHEAYHAIKEDPQLISWFSDFRALLEHIVMKPDELAQEETKQRINEISNRARSILKDEKWRLMFNNLADKFLELIDAIKHDSTTNEWRSKIEKLFKDLFFNEMGEPDLFVLEDSVHQLRNLVVPLFRKTLANIPIKKIEVFSDTYDVRIEDIVFDATSFLPEHLDFKMLNVSHLDLNEKNRDYAKHQLLLQVDHIKPEFRHLKFYYRRKTFPQIVDYGIADVALAGEGAKIQVIWTIEQKGLCLPVSHITAVDCEIDKLNIHIGGETKHKWLDSFLAPLLSGMLKNKIAGYMEEYLKSKLEHINEQINQFLWSKPTEHLLIKMDQAMKIAYHQMEKK
jgi:hypothetical protein